MDAHSKWIEAHIVSSTSSEASIEKLRMIFAIHGIPEHIISDNGTGFTSKEFKQFTESNGIKHAFTSPYHPASNGLAERTVETVKSGISKLDGSIESRLSTFLLTYRITPHTSTGISPSELLMGRRIRTCLDLCHPDTTQKVIQKQEKFSNRFHSRNFKIGDRLFVRNFIGSQKWIPVEVIKVNGPLSYVLKTNSGVRIRCHVDHLRFRYCDNFDNNMPEQDDTDDWPLPKQFSMDVASRSNVSSSTSLPPRRSTRTSRPVNRYTPQCYLEEEGML